MIHSQRKRKIKQNNNNNKKPKWGRRNFLEGIDVLLALMLTVKTVT
jgi:hypothetical protein